MIKGILSTPVLLAVLTGVILSVTGIGGWIESSSIGPVLGGVCEFIAAPTSSNPCGDWISRTLSELHGRRSPK